MSADKRFTSVYTVQSTRPQDELLDMIYGLASSWAAPRNLLYTSGCHQYPQFMRSLVNCTWAGRS